MSESRLERRLAAILAADVVGFSRMMEKDETGVLAELKARRRNILMPQLARHKGRVVKLMGDGVLIEFGSAVDAVHCAVALHQDFSAANSAAGHQIILRIGINVGDVIVEGGDLYGDGVNIASRLEGLAPPGGVLVSEAVHVQVRGKVTVAFADAGHLLLKNIETAVRAWTWGGAAKTVGQVTRPGSGAVTTETRPSIAVLPFANMSGDPEQEYFSDGISEDVITDLSKIAGLLVVSRNSSFAYKGKVADVREVGQALQVTSVLEGSIRRSGNRVRISAQLIDAGTGHHLWAERYDRELTDIFAVQDEVTKHIVDALRVTLKPAEQALLGRGRTQNVEAHDCFLRGRELLLAPIRNRADFDRILDVLGRAIDLDPGYAEPHAGLGLAHLFDFNNKWGYVPDALDRSFDFFARAMQLDPNEPYAHYAAAVVCLFRRDLEGAQAQTRKALALNPNYALAYGTRGSIEVFLGRPAEAEPYLLHAIRLDPANTGQYLHFLGLARLVAGDDEAAVATFEDRIRRAPHSDTSRAYMIAALGHLGRLAEARQTWGEIVAINPMFSFKDTLARLPFRNPADLARLAEGIRKARLVD